MDIFSLFCLLKCSLDCIAPPLVFFLVIFFTYHSSKVWNEIFKFFFRDLALFISWKRLNLQKFLSNHISTHFIEIGVLLNGSFEEILSIIVFKEYLEVIPVYSNVISIVFLIQIDNVLLKLNTRSVQINSLLSELFQIETYCDKRFILTVSQFSSYFHTTT